MEAVGEIFLLKLLRQFTGRWRQPELSTCANQTAEAGWTTIPPVRSLFLKTRLFMTGPLIMGAYLAISPHMLWLRPLRQVTIFLDTTSSCSLLPRRTRTMEVWEEVVSLTVQPGYRVSLYMNWVIALGCPMQTNGFLLAKARLATTGLTSITEIPFPLWAEADTGRTPKMCQRKPESNWTQNWKVRLPCPSLYGLKT